MPAVPPVSRSIRILSATASVALASVAAGSNVSTPMLPMYRESLGLSLFTVSALFSVYLVVLVGMFLILARTRLARLAWAMLPLALTMQLVASTAMWIGADDTRWLFVGRAVGGAAVSLATTSTATLVGFAIGARGRARMATASIAGAAVGLVVGTLIAVTNYRPLHLIYEVHALSIIVVLIVLTSSLMRCRHALRHLSAPLVNHSRRIAQHHWVRPTRLRRFAAYGAGATGWVVGGIAAGVLPSSIRQQFGTEAVLAYMLLPLLLVCVASTSPVLLRACGFAVSVTGSMSLIIGGGFLVTTALLSKMLWPLVIGGVFWGISQGAAYAHGLSVLTRGMSPVQQGRTASGYAAWSYALTAFVTLTAGAVSSFWGIPRSSAYTSLLLTILCAAVVVVERRANVADQRPKTLLKQL